MSEPRARPMDRDELTSHVMGFSMHLCEQPASQPLAALHLCPPVTVPGSGWGQVARVSSKDEVWWLAVIDALELPGSPLWVQLSNDQGHQQLLVDTTTANMGKYGTPTSMLLVSAVPVLNALAMHRPVVGPR